jgi:hypothetical protein
MTFPEENNLEVWKTIPGYEDYSVSTWGRVRRDTFGQGVKQKKTIQPSIHKKGYLQIILSINGKRIIKKLHRLVAITFLPNPDNLPEVDHIDDNKKNNNVNNLKWSTGLNNIRRSWESGNHNKLRGSNLHNSKLTEKEVFQIKILLKQGLLTGKQIAEMYNCDTCTITLIKKGKTWKHVILPTES